MKAAAGLAAFLLAAGALAAPPGWSRREIRVEGNATVVRVWTLEGADPGPTLLIFGGIHGDEPGGYLTADSVVDRIGLLRGKIVLVPRANLESILEGERGAEGDLNRMFGRPHPQPVIAVLEDLIGQADAFLNLHDGWGYYRESWVDEEHSPRRFGQTVVADTDSYTTPDGKVLDLQGMARRVVARVNAFVRDDEHRFRFLDTRTDEPGSPYADLVHSATYFGLTHYGIPGFGVETSKNLPSDALKVRYQLLVIKAFLNEFGLVEDPVPVPEMEAPRLDFVLLRVGEEPLRALRPGEALEVPGGSTVRIEGVEANVERGLVVDVVGRGGLDDLGTPFVVDAPLKVEVHRDSALLGTATVRPAPVPAPKPSVPVAVAARPAGGRTSDAISYRVQVGGSTVQVGENQVVEVWSGDVIRLLDPVPATAYDPSSLSLDLVGFPGGSAASPHDDRGFAVETDTQLLDRYSVLGRGEYYRVQARLGDRETGGFYIRVRPSSLLAVTVERGDGRRVRLEEGGRLRVPRGEVVTIREVETTVPQNRDVLVNLKGFSGGKGGEDRGLPVHTDRDLLPDWALDPQGRLYEVLVLHHERPIGRVLLELEDRSEQPSRNDAPPLGR